MSHYMYMLFAATEALHLQCKRRGTNCPFGSWEFILDCIFLVLQFLNQCRYYHSPATWLAQLFTITWLAAQNDSTGVGSVCIAIFSYQASDEELPVYSKNAIKNTPIVG